MRAASRPFVLLALCVTVPVLGAHWVDTDAPAQMPSEPTAAVPVRSVPAVPEPAPEYTVERFFLGQGGTLAAACERLGMEPETRRVVLATAARHLDLRRLSPRTGLAASRDSDGRVVGVAIRSDAERFLRVTLPHGETPLRAEVFPLALETRVLTAGGVVTSSVAQALGHASYSQRLTQAYADIFQWDVDLLVDPRPGDEVKLVYEVETLGDVPADLPGFGKAAVSRGDLVQVGRVLAASYDGRNASATAYWVENGPSWGNYFDAAGRPLRKSFLKSPLNYRRISSGFSRARRHPVTRKVVPHRGSTSPLPPALR